jgi:hypothetical protein
MVNLLLNLFEMAICTAVIYIVIAVLWQIAELQFYGKVTPRLMDDVIAVILAISLYFNLK